MWNDAKAFLKIISEDKFTLISALIFGGFAVGFQIRASENEEEKFIGLIAISAFLILLFLYVLILLINLCKKGKEDS